MCCSSLSKSYLDNFVCNANNVIYFKLVRSLEDLSNENESQESTFQPEFCHQLFGQSENIFGYQNLRVNLYYTASKLNRCISISYSDKVSEDLSQGVPPDDIFQIINEKLQGQVITNIDQFSALLSHDHDFKPYGTLIDSFKKKFKSTDGTISERGFEIYRCEIENQSGFEAYHENMQTFLIWFIDAASYIDTSDRKWDYFVIYEKVTNFEAESSWIYYFIGYSTVYRYYAYPDKIRPRISQFLILPPFQRKGLGAKLLQNVYNYYYSDNSIIDITVEDPSEEFSHLRDYVDCLNCSRIPTFQENELKKGWNDEMAKEAQEKFKLNKKQTRRVYEILKLKSINRNDSEEMRLFRLEVKNRLNAPYLKVKRSILSEEEENSVFSNKESRLQELNLLYSQVEEDYRHTIDKLSRTELN